ncbi:GH25 family lysozyme [Sphingobium aquiterrae]|uniref:GH25 family lysozyme n=1 Tax=Sphingobium aquiterrae TaxID=2038656 RepID=UPI003018FD5C
MSPYKPYGRRGAGAQLLRLAIPVAGLALAALAAWIYAGYWTPSRETYPVQGLSVSAASGTIDWGTVRVRQADFVYVRASTGSDRRDPAFAANWAGARAAGLRYGAEHLFSLCRNAADQATLFMTTVPRDNAALPPVVRLDFEPGCATRPSRDALLSELNTFLNLIEGHAGKPALLRVSRAFDASYDIGSGINRTLWLEGNFLAPDYAAHPWVMWTASNMRRLDGVEKPVEWDVVAP